MNSTEPFDRLATELEKEADSWESTCIRNYGGVSIESETGIRATRDAAKLIRQLGMHNYLGALGLKITRHS